MKQVLAYISPWSEKQNIKEGVVTIDFGMNLLDACCRNESLTATFFGG